MGWERRHLAGLFVILRAGPVAMIEPARRRRSQAATSAFVGLNTARASLTSRPMKLTMAFVVWFAMAAVLIKGLIMAVNGHTWLLVVGLLGFVVLVGKIGCLTHD